MMNRKLRLALLFALLFSTSCNSSASEPEEILRKEQERIQYLTSGEFDLLSDMLTPTMTYTHSNGTLDHKDQYMNSLTSQQVIYRSLDHNNLEVRFVTPDLAILNGTSDVAVTVDGVDEDVPLRFSIVYVRDGGDWKFEAWHSSGLSQ